jgi:AcrR family transcriptional regulator
MAILVDEEEKRRAITDAALKLFVSKGYRATTTRDICAAAGISMGALYHYFRDKEDLLVGSVARSVEEDMRARSEISGRLASRQDAMNLLRDRFVSRFAEYQKQTTFITDFVINHDQAIVEAMLKDRFETWIALHEEILRAHPGPRPVGPPTLVSARDVAVLWECTGQGLLFLSHAVSDLDFERYARLFWELMAEHLEEGQEEAGASSGKKEGA